MRKRILPFLLFSILLNIPFLLFAQSGYEVTGYIVSADDNQPLIGVSVLEKGTTNGVITDINGYYTLVVTQSPAIISYSYIGMEKVEKSVTAATRIDLALRNDAQLVDEVVVVAYGTRKKGTIAGSVATVKAEKMANVPAPGFDQALQGQAPGLLVVSNTGEPSVAAEFRIRGNNSINSGMDPLFILDGIPISSSDFNTINPNDIESISVLKDASSTSIYGARASNGVIVITSKRGLSMDRAEVTFRTQVGFSQVAHGNWEMMNTPERIQFEKEVGLDSGKDYEILGLTNINWMDVIYDKHALLQSYELSVNRATNNMNYYVSGGAYNQEGIAQGSLFRRYNLRANADVKASDRLKIGTTSMFVYEEYEQADEGDYSIASPISASHFMLPYWNPYKEDGTLASGNDGSWTGTGVNPIEWMDNNPVTYKKYKALATVYAEVTIIPNLTLRSQLGIDFTHNTGFAKSYPSYVINNSEGSASRATTDVVSLTSTTTANYQFQLNEIHSFRFMVGQEGTNYHSEGFQLLAKGQTNDQLTDISSATRVSAWSDSFSEYAYLSFFGRGEYNYEDRYYADFSIRADASSRFGKSKRWGAFWSVGLMWNLRKEAFMEGCDWLTNAQIALSTGTSGNSDISNYGHYALVSGGITYMDEAGIYPSQSKNDDFGWETTQATNLALHLGFKNRISVDAEFYNKRTSNMLMYVPQSYALTGEGNHWENVGVFVNRGAELSVNADIIHSKKLIWNLSANFSYNKNKIKELYNGVTEYENSSTLMKYTVGHSTGEFYINRYAGVNPANGDALWYTKDGEITTEFNESDKVMIGKSRYAPWQGGFGTTLSWNGFSLSAQFSWVAGRWMFNNDRYMDESNGLFSSSYNQSRRLLYDRWKNPGDVTDIPRYGVTPEMDSRFLEDASFLRLKNLVLSYSFPQPLLKKSHFFTAARIYLQGQNLLTFTKFSGLDPESNLNIYRATYPMSRQYTAGIEISF